MAYKVVYISWDQKKNIAPLPKCILYEKDCYGMVLLEKLHVQWKHVKEYNGSSLFIYEQSNRCSRWNSFLLIYYVGKLLARLVHFIYCNGKITMSIKESTVVFNILRHQLCVFCLNWQQWNVLITCINIIKNVIQINLLYTLLQIHLSCAP